MSRSQSTMMGLSFRRGEHEAGWAPVPPGSTPRWSARSMDAVSRFDSRDIAQLFERHGPRVYRRALRLLGNPGDAEEATQEIFLRVFRAASGFREQSQMTTWLYQITTNYCLNLIRDRSRRAQIHEAHLMPMAEESSRSAPTRPEDLVLLRRLLAAADERQAAAAVYVFLDGMSHEEAAELLGVSKRTVGNLLERFQAWAQEQIEPPAVAAPGSGNDS